MKCIPSIISIILLAQLVACGGEQKPSQENPKEVEVQAQNLYEVGSTTFFIHDGSRPFDSVAGVNDGIRTMITEVWYPADSDAIQASGDQIRRATYGDYVFGNLDMHRLMMTKTTFFHLTPDSVREGVSDDQIDAAILELFNRERESYVDAPLAQSDTAFPVVVMSHGDAGSRYNMETVCEYLAAHGYVVIAPEHTGNSPYSMTGSDPALSEENGDTKFRAAMQPVLALLNEHGAYGSEANYGQSYTPLSSGRGSLSYLQALDTSLLQRLNDLRATLSELDRMNTHGQFAGRLALDRIGLMGRSFGGATTLVGVAMEPRFTSGFAVVPPGWTDQRKHLPAEALVPSDRESVLLSAEGSNPFSEFNKPLFLLSGAEDSLIIGLAVEMARTGDVPAPTPDNPHSSLRQAYEQASAPIVWGLLADSNHATFGVSGSYWWPELKPDTQKRHFEPEVSFKLIAPARGHEMQKQKALAFFDLTIREDQSAKEPLLDQAFSAEGLSLESRNL